MKKFACAIMGVLCLGALVMAGSPQLIDYQGFLKDGSGNPVTGSLNFTFKIYTALTGGTQKWTETQNSISVTGGLFNVSLGASTPIPDTVFNQADRWLGITVGAGTELSPRTRISSAAYGQRVNTIDGASGGIVSSDITAGKGNFGSGNTNAGKYAFVAGYHNTASGDSSGVGGGANNTASGAAAFVGAGQTNTASGNYSTVGGGTNNTASGASAFVGAGQTHIASGLFSTVAGGDANSATATWSLVGGGHYNIASNEGAVVAGGRSNRARGVYSVVCGGGGTYTDSNSALGALSFIGGGKQNIVAGESGVVCGGYHNRATSTSNFNTIGGGENNTISGGARAVIAGGSVDTITADLGAIGGGAGNRVSGYAGTVPGGILNLATGHCSFAAGRIAQAIHNGAFVWADSLTTAFASTAANQFSVRATGGVRIYTNSGLTAGVTMAAGASAWSSVSDSTRKQNIRLVNRKDILQKLMTLPIKEWSYKAQDPSIEHVGPMAQDFYAIFGLGDDDKTISTIDPSGIALAAIQALNEKTEELKAKTDKIDQLEKKLADLRSAVEMILTQSSAGKAGSEKLSVVTDLSASAGR